MFNFILNSPMEQYVIFPLFSLNLTINNVILYLLFAAFISLGFSLIKTNRNYIISDYWQILSESLFSTQLSLVVNYIGVKFTIYLPLIYTIFHVILFSNLIGLVPYSSTPLVEIIMTMSLAFTLLMGILIIGFLNHQLKLFAAFIPAGTPFALVPLMVVLEVLAYLTRTFSLGLR